VNSTGDYRVRDLAEMTLTLRQDLTITPRHDGDESGYLIEDKVNSKYYRIGVAEYSFIANLDGKTTVCEAVGIAARVEPEHAITEEQAATVCRWLVENQLAFTPESVSTPGLEASRSRADQSPGQARWNPLFLRIPLLRPEGLLRRLLPWTGWLFSWPAALAAALLVAVAGNQVLTHWSRLVTSSRGIFSTERWLWIAAAWLVVKLFHELAHGIVCKRYGGSVRESGVVLILGAPVAYMDVTSSWRFRSKWQRIHTAVAGIYVELLIAAVAAIVWSHVQAGVVSDLCFQVMILASVTTVLFNANPLMRFDGYYILSDLLELPNLYGESQQFLRHLMRKYVLGVHSHLSSNWTRASIFAVYGVAALAWRVFVCCSIVLAAASAFRGAGVVVAAVGIVLWIAPATVAVIKYLVYGTAWEQPRRLRFLAATGVIGTVLTVALVCLPWPCAYRAPAMVEYAPLAIVRATGDGFVREIQVEIGQKVEPGQVLVVLENEQLRLEVSELQIRVRGSKSHVRALRYEAKMAESQAEAEQLTSLERRLQEKQEQLEALTLRAEVPGTVISRDLDSLRGTYLKQGAEVLVIGSEDRKELNISIAQEDVDIFSDHLQQSLWVRIHGAPRFATSLAKVSPRARREPSSQGFCATLGGPLPVRTLNSMSTGGDAQPRYELLAPRFDGNLNLSRDQSLSLFAGQRGFVALRASNRSIADHLLSRLRHWLRSRTGNLPQVL
jgi:putative peptide zinc metalloprotease protein